MSDLQGNPGCEVMQLRVQADLDRELSATESAEVTAHVAACPACAALQHDLSALSIRLRTEVVRHPTPNSLRDAVMTRLAPKTAVPPMPRGFRRRVVMPLSGFGAGAAIAACLAWLLLPVGVTGGLDAELVAGHIRALQPGHLTDVLSSDQHTVKPWFAGRIDYAPPVMDLAASGSPLVGGRLDYIGGRPVAALVYRHAKHDIDLFLWPGENAGPASEARTGYNVVSWTANGMTLHAVSDLNAAELKDFALKWRTLRAEQAG